MEIALHTITIKELYDGYQDNGDRGVFGYHGKLNIRPPYQREFIYTGNLLLNVIRSVNKGFPLNVMYWVTNPDDTYEILDGQQRTLSLCRFIDGAFSVDGHFFSSYEDDIKEKFLNYQLLVYFCTGQPSERIEWFKTINIKGLELKPQELRNAVYHGPWLASAKTWFSKPNCPAHQCAEYYMNKDALRQEYLETALNWISGGHIEEYMGEHRQDASASELWLYFKSVMDWVSCTFPDHYSVMKTVDWHSLYQQYHTKVLNISALSTKIAELMDDSEVTNKKGIFSYVLSGNEQDLQLRTFGKDVKRRKYKEQNGICPRCHKHFEFEQMHGDHIVPWSKGGKTEESNCQMLCSLCNERKGSS